MTSGASTPGVLDGVPAAWKLAPLGSVVSVVSGATPSKDHPEFWSGTIPWVSPKDMKVPVIADSEDHVSEAALAASPLKVVEPPAVLLVIRGMILAHTVPVALAAAPVTLNQDMKALRPRAGVHARFLAYQLRALGPVLLSMVEEAGHGTRCLRTDLWRKLMVAVPPEAVQHAIADFLDRKTAAIDALIEQEERLVAAAEERRAALISEVVLGALSTAKRRDTDSPLGAIPEHWAVMDLRRRWKVIDCKHKTPDYVVEGFPLVSTTEVKPGRLDLSRVTRFVSSTDFADMTDGRLPRRGDIIYSRNASLGAAAYVDTDEPFCMGQDVVLITSRHEDQLFLQYELNSAIVTSQIERDSIGSTFKRINVEQILALKIVVPPPHEQREIARVLDDRASTIDCLMATMRQSVERLREYRQALITAAVTGQLDIAAQEAA